MDLRELVQIRDFQSLLGDHLSLRNQSRLSVVCKASKNALCDPQKVAVFRDKLNAEIDRLRRLGENVESSEDTLIRALLRFIHSETPLYVKTRRAISEKIGIRESPNFKLVFNLTVLILAFARSNKELMSLLERLLTRVPLRVNGGPVPKRRPGEARPDYDVLSKDLNDLGQMLGHMGMTYLVYLLDREGIVKPGTGVEYGLLSNLHIRDILTYLITKKATLNVRDNLDSTLDQASEMVIKPLIAFQKAHREYLEQKSLVSTMVKKIGNKDLHRQFRRVSWRALDHLVPVGKDMKPERTLLRYNSDMF